MTLTAILRAMLLREIRVYFRNRGAWLNPLIFILLAVTLFAFGVGPDSAALSGSAVGIIWVVALLGIMMSLDALFRSDFDDGSLEQMLLSPAPLYFTVTAKVVAHWLVTGMPMVLVSPLLAVMLGLPAHALPALAVGLALGSGVLSILGAIGAAVTVSLRSGGLLIALLILPLYVPVIIFGAGMVQNAVEGWPIGSSMFMLSGLLIGAFALAPLAIIGGLRISVDN